MSSKNATNTKKKSIVKKIKTVGGITEYVLTTNSMRILFYKRKGSGIVTSNIVYRVGSRDEARGETGVAHMLEHMLFKPTTHDIKRKTEPGATFFERETGIILNANTWKDRTCYYFSYPKEYFLRALQIEAERMHDVVLTDKVLKPEQTNVLSEFDMYAGDEAFALSVQMTSVAFQSHPYGHETIGYREDIEDYTAEKLKKFYKKYYTPNNATLIIVGDIEEQEMMDAVMTNFSKIPVLVEHITREVSREPKQEGKRLVVIERSSQTNMLACGVLHEGFPSKNWFITHVIFDMLAGGEDSVLHRALIDTGRATAVSTTLEPTSEKNLGILFITLSKGNEHEKVFGDILKIIQTLTEKDIAKHLKKTIAKTIASEASSREQSRGFAQELVEYVSAGTWEAFFNSEKILRTITAHDIYQAMQKLFQESQLTLGYFKGRNIN